MSTRLPFGRVHYENETGEFHTVDCPDQASYERELKVGCKWVESEPRRFLNLWGERFPVANTDPTPTAAALPDHLNETGRTDQ